MPNFQRIATDVDTAPLMAELFRQPGLWGQNAARTAPGSPHEGIPDIWARTAPPAWFDNVRDGPFVPEAWPAWHALPSIAPIAFALMTRFRAVQLGNVLLTKIPTRGEVKAHADHGWGPDFFDLKFYVVLQGNDRCVNWCEEDRVTMRTGEVWLFRNTVPHGVVNEGETDRVSLIITMRSM